jgi:hypothetical protein
MRSVLALVAILASGVPAVAFDGAERDFLGVWRNLDRASPGVTRLEIRPDQGNNVAVRVWRRCPSGECELGRATGRIFVNRNELARETDQAAILVRFARDDFGGNVLIRLSPRGDVIAHALFSGGRGGDSYAVERFERAGSVSGPQEEWPRRRH